MNYVCDAIYCSFGSLVEILAEILQEPQLYEELALNKFESVAICGKVVFLGFDLWLVEIPVFVLSTQEK